MRRQAIVYQAHYVAGLMLGRNVLRRLVSAQRHSSFELVRKTASLGHLRILSSLLDTS